MEGGCGEHTLQGLFRLRQEEDCARRPPRSQLRARPEHGAAADSPQKARGGKCGANRHRIQSPPNLPQLAGLKKPSS